MVDAVNEVREAARPLTGAAADYDPLMELIGGSRFVLLGEASHGTHEFYRERAQITKRLIKEKGFSAVVVEEQPDGSLSGSAQSGYVGDTDYAIERAFEAVRALRSRR